MDIGQYYIENAGFKDYVDRYCKKHGVSLEEAFTHRLVADVFDYYYNEKGRVVENDGNSCGDN